MQRSGDAEPYVLNKNLKIMMSRGTPSQKNNEVKYFNSN